MTGARKRVAREIAPGQEFGEFTVVDGPFPAEKEGQTGWTLRHTCGATISRTSHSLRYNPRTFCPGCMVKHGNRTERTQEQRDAIGARTRTSASFHSRPVYSGVVNGVPEISRQISSPSAPSTVQKHIPSGVAIRPKRITAILLCPKNLEITLHKKPAIH